MSRPDESSLTYNETVQLISEFLEVAIHTIICVRQVYPSDVFARRKKYNTPVYQSRHPGLNEYIAGIVKAACAEISKSSVQRVVVLIKDEQSDEAYERFVFELDYILPETETADRNYVITNGFTQSTLELYLRGFMLKLMVLESSLAPLPEETTFAVILEMKDGKSPSSSNKNEPPEGPWVPADDGSVATGTSASQRSEAGTAPGKGTGTGMGQPTGAKILPVKSFDSGVINLMLYIEEHASSKSRSSLRSRSSFPFQAAAAPGAPTCKDKGKAKDKGKGRDISRERERQRERERERERERDLDEPLPSPTPRRARVADEEDEDSEMDSGSEGMGMGEGGGRGESGC